VRVRAGARDDRLGVGTLVVAGLVEEGGERLLPVAYRPRVLGFGAKQVIHSARDRGGVESAGQARADRNVAP